MPFNKLKKYPDLLDIAFMSDRDRNNSLRGIFDRDITDNPNFIFRGKRIYPLKSDGVLDMLNIEYLTFIVRNAYIG